MKHIAAALVVWIALGTAPAAAQDDVLVKLYTEARDAEAAGNYAIATQRYERIVAMRPSMAEAHANLGNLYYVQGFHDRAAASLQTSHSPEAFPCSSAFLPWSFGFQFPRLRARGDIPEGRRAPRPRQPPCASVSRLYLVCSEQISRSSGSSRKADRLGQNQSRCLVSPEQIARPAFQTVFREAPDKASRFVLHGSGKKSLL